MYSMCTGNARRRYDLEYSPAGMRIHVCPEYARFIHENFNPDSFRGIAPLQSEFGISFTPPGKKYWGFEQCLATEPSTIPGWECYRLRLPRGGHKIDSRKGRALSATLNCLFSILMFDLEGFQMKDPYLEPSQLITIEFAYTHRGMSGSSIAASLTPTACSWIDRDDVAPGMQESISEAMRTVFLHMSRHGASDDDIPGFRGMGRLYPKRTISSDFANWLKKPTYLHLSVPSNACDLDADYSDLPDRAERNVFIHPHNIDTPTQQMSLLAGLMQLNTLMRKDIK